MATQSAYKAVGYDYMSCWKHVRASLDRHERFTALDYHVGNTVTAAESPTKLHGFARGGIYLYVHDATGLREAKGTAFALADYTGVPGTLVAGTLGRVLEVEYDDASDMLGGVPSQSTWIRVSSCTVVSEISLD
jgi:hypothetical protein